MSVITKSVVFVGQMLVEQSKEVGGPTQYYWRNLQISEETLEELLDRKGNDTIHYEDKVLRGDQVTSNMFAEMYVKDGVAYGSLESALGSTEPSRYSEERFCMEGRLEVCLDAYKDSTHKLVAFTLAPNLYEYLVEKRDYRTVKNANFSPEGTPLYLGVDLLKSDHLKKGEFVVVLERRANV